MLIDIRDFYTSHQSGLAVSLLSGSQHLKKKTLGVPLLMFGQTLTHD
jgi:hypothetical protein